MNKNNILTYKYLFTKKWDMAINRIMEQEKAGLEPTTIVLETMILPN